MQSSRLSGPLSPGTHAVGRERDRVRGKKYSFFPTIFFPIDLPVMICFNPTPYTLYLIPYA